MLLETFPRGQRHFLVCLSVRGPPGAHHAGHAADPAARAAGRRAAGIRLQRLRAGDLGDEAAWTGLDFADLFAEDMLGDDLESWLARELDDEGGFQDLRADRRPDRAAVSAATQKSGRQITFSTDLVYDVLRRHQPDHLLLRCARADAAKGMVDVARLGRLLARIKGRILHAALDHLSPFSVP